MSGSDRGIILAIVGWLAFVSFISWDAAQQEKPEKYCETTAKGRECRPQQYTTERAFIPSSFERAISNPEPRTGEDHEKRDLAAQEASAAFAFWMAAFAGFSALVTLIGTILLYKQIKLTQEAVTDTGEATKAMRETNEIARETMRRQLRAYVALHEFSWETDRHDYRVQIVWINGGQTPAYNADARATWGAFDDPLPPDYSFPLTQAYEGEGCSMLGPGKTIYGTSRVPMPKEMAELAAMQRKHVYAWGRAEYTDAFGESHYTNVAVKLNVERLTDKTLVIRWSSFITHNDAT